MFVKSQENEYWNLDQVQGLWTNQSGEVRILIANEKRVALGQYSSKEQADKVLDYILEENSVSDTIHNPHRVIAMPEEAESQEKIYERNPQHQ